MGTLTAVLALAPALSATVAPRYVHDCDCCLFLGHVDAEGVRPRDAYVCTTEGEPLLLMRASSRPEDNRTYGDRTLAMLRDRVNSPEIALGIRAYDAWVSAGRPAKG